MEGKLKVWIRRVWTLEMVSHSLLFEQRANLHPECYWLAVRTQATKVAQCLIGIMGNQAYIKTGSRYLPFYELSQVLHSYNVEP